jgi:hypothetical protein
VAAQSDAVLLAIRASAPQLVELKLDPPVEGTARLGLVRLSRRTPPHAPALRRPMDERLADEPPRKRVKRAR